MADKRLHSAPHFRSFPDLVTHITSENLGHVDSREWKEEWSDRWVVYADLVAFASRALRSEMVVLNNILRFDRASTLVAAQFPATAVRRFSDATLAVAQTFHEALAFGVALSHTCLAFNRELLDREAKPFFIYLIVPRITLARGRVLLLKSSGADQDRFKGLDPKNIIAGSAIVRAYQMERHSAGGLITIDRDAAKLLGTMKVRGDNSPSTNAIRRWLPRLSDDTAVAAGKVFFHRDQVVDIPWLLLRPHQYEENCLWGSGKNDAGEAITTFLAVWEKRAREFYSPQNFNSPLETAKHYQAAVRHGVQCYHAIHGRKVPKYQAAQELL